ncbi:MAG: phosphatidylserine/phosphatidylglycerophosphate/cardiolipin synthase family protein [Bacteroidales bacterium]|jgi:cardiolipin synthase|nr:phosphatidylserine/phosphatidylglycerophosphate/cardiolipin synthase family protein [Bacteroidales bacterium]
MEYKRRKDIITSDEHTCYKFYSFSSIWYDDVLNDIYHAKKYIYLETFRISNDNIGKQLCDALIDSHERGIKVRVLVDWWGTGTTNDYVQSMIKKGIEVRFFKKFILSIFLFSRNHRRDHRKIIVIDDWISYLGSANFTAYSTKWREAILRIEGKMSTICKKIFIDNFKIYNKDITHPSIRKAFRRTIRYNDFFFIREVPSIFSQRIKKNYIRLIQRSQESIVIETPYFLPGYRIYKELILAIKRGVKVKIIIPKTSDVKIVDYVRGTILEKLHKKGATILYYKHGNLHAKLLSIDNVTFSISSANMDHRSFKYMFEIALIGADPDVNALINEHLLHTELMSSEFDIQLWENRPLFKRLLSFIITPFSHLL